MKLLSQMTLPETSSKFAPENGWLEDDPFLLGPGQLFSIKKEPWTVFYHPEVDKKM